MSVIARTVTSLHKAFFYTNIFITKTVLLRDRKRITARAPACSYPPGPNFFWAGRGTLKVQILLLFFFFLGGGVPSRSKFSRGEGEYPQGPNFPGGVPSRSKFSGGGGVPSRSKIFLGGGRAGTLQIQIFRGAGGGGPSRSKFLGGAGGVPSRSKFSGGGGASSRSKFSAGGTLPPPPLWTDKVKT